MPPPKSELDDMMGTILHEGRPTSPALPFGAGAPRTGSVPPIAGGRFILCWASEPARPHVEEAYGELLDAFDDDEAPEAPTADAFLVVLDRAERSRTAADVREHGLRSSGTGELPPYMVVAGQLVVEVDPVARLRFIHGILSLEPSSDPGRAAALERVARLLATPAVHASRSRIAAARSELLPYAASPADLEEEARTALVGTGELATCQMFGEEHVRGRLRLDGEDVPLYLPRPAASALPHLPELSVVAIVERFPRLEVHESSPHALRLHAVGLVRPDAPEARPVR